MQKDPKPQTINHKLQTGSQSGVALVFAIIMLMVVLSVTIGLVSVFAPRLRTSSDTKNSVGALFAADSGAELCLYEARRQLPVPSPRVTSLLTGEATFTISSSSQQFGKMDVTSDCRPLGAGGDVFRFEVLGTYRGVNRALRVNQ